MSFLGCRQLTVWLRRQIVGMVTAGAMAGALGALAALPPLAMAQATFPQEGVREAPPAAILQPRSRWLPAQWSDLPGLPQDALFEAWNAWLKSCEKPLPAFATVCTDVRRMSIGSNEEQLSWLKSRLQPYRVQAHQGDDTGLLTGYFEPVLLGQAGDAQAPHFAAQRCEHRARSLTTFKPGVPGLVQRILAPARQFSPAHRCPAAFGLQQGAGQGPGVVRPAVLGCRQSC